jgi:hypothetical protein
MITAVLKPERRIWAENRVAVQPVKKKLSMEEGRSMIADKNRAVWLGLALTAVIQAVIFSGWIGALSERVSNNSDKMAAMLAEQKTQAQLVYAVPYVQQTVTEIKGDVKELKQLMLHSNNNQKIGP